MRIIEGLREDICAVVIIQQTVDLDAACRLALLQEEIAGGLRRDKPRGFEPYIARAPLKAAAPLPCLHHQPGGAVWLARRIVNPLMLHVVLLIKTKSKCFVLMKTNSKLFKFYI
jgi:hypothetical protein